MGNPISTLVFAPPESTYDEEVPAKVSWLLTRKRKKIPAYWWKAKGGETKQTIVYSHGNATDLGGMFEFMQLLHENLQNVNLLFYDYVGYGIAKDYGVPSEAGVYESVEAAIYFLRELNILPKHVIVFGTSLGSGPSCYISQKLGVRGLILECPFLSCVKVVTSTPIGRLVDMFRNEDRIADVECPVLILHGRKDTVVPFIHGETLFSKVQPHLQYKFVDLPEAGHHDIIDHMSLYEYLKTIYDFIKHCEENYEEHMDSPIFKKNRLKSVGSIFNSANPNDLEGSDIE